LAEVDLDLLALAPQRRLEQPRRGAVQHLGDDDLADRRRRRLAVAAVAGRVGDVAVDAQLGAVQLDPLVEAVRRHRAVNPIEVHVDWHESLLPRCLSRRTGLSRDRVTSLLDPCGRPAHLRKPGFAAWILSRTEEFAASQSATARQKACYEERGRDRI